MTLLSRLQDAPVGTRDVPEGFEPISFISDPFDFPNEGRWPFRVWHNCDGTVSRIPWWWLGNDYYDPRKIPHCASCLKPTASIGFGRFCTTPGCKKNTGYANDTLRRDEMLRKVFTTPRWRLGNIYSLNLPIIAAKEGT